MTAFETSFLVEMSSQDSGERSAEPSRKKKRLSARFCPGLVGPDGTSRVKCGRPMHSTQIDGHIVCQACLNYTCDAGVCDYCENWPDDLRAIFRARYNKPRARALLKAFKNKNLDKDAGSSDILSIGDESLSPMSSLLSSPGIPCAQKPQLEAQTEIAVEVVPYF